MDAHRQDIREALSASYFFLKFRPRTKKEMRDYLHKKEFGDEVIEEVIKKLTEQNFVNDTAFIQWIFDQRTSHKQKSAFAIRQELFKYGIEKDLIDDFFSNNTVDEEELARNAIASRLRRWEGLPPEEKKKKIYAFLLQRGFGYEIINRVVNGLES